MDTPPSPNHYKNHRFPVEIISHAVWLYFRFCLSFRDVEERLVERGMVVIYKAIRKWCREHQEPGGAAYSLGLEDGGALWLFKPTQSPNSPTS